MRFSLKIAFSAIKKDQPPTAQRMAGYRIFDINMDMVASNVCLYFVEVILYAKEDLILIFDTQLGVRVFSETQKSRKYRRLCSDAKTESRPGNSRQSWTAGARDNKRSNDHYMSGWLPRCTCTLPKHRSSQVPKPSIMGAKQRAPSTGPQSGGTSSSLDGAAPLFLPLEETMMEEDLTSKRATSIVSRLNLPKFNGRKVLISFIAFVSLIIICQYFFVKPKDRIIQPDSADKFLLWVEKNPGWGLWAISLAIAAAVVTMIPIGTPLTLGCGYIYRGVYGWRLGIAVATVVSMAGSCMGAVICFLLGRYLMRETVQQWVRKYPLFDAINTGMYGEGYSPLLSFSFLLIPFSLYSAAKEHGFKIMAMLYLTPVIPLGLVSYMCGTTSMNIYAFALAKIFALPLYLIYTFMGASAHSFVKRGTLDEAAGISATDQTKQLEDNQLLLISGLLLSIVMMGLITRYIRKELMKVSDEEEGTIEENAVMVSPNFLLHSIQFSHISFLFRSWTNKKRTSQKARVVWNHLVPVKIPKIRE